MSGLGQTEKNSLRANVFGVTPESGHCSMQSACRHPKTFTTTDYTRFGGGNAAERRVILASRLTDILLSAERCRVGHAMVPAPGYVKFAGAGSVASHDNSRLWHRPSVLKWRNLRSHTNKRPNILR